MSKQATIFGATGQDGSYLTELLLEKDYQVIGVKRRTSTNNTERLTNVLQHPNFKLVEGDLIDPSSVLECVKNSEEVYNLAAQSHVGTSFKQPVATFQINAVGVLNILETIRLNQPETRFYQASTSEMFGSNYTEEWLRCTDPGYIGGTNHGVGISQNLTDKQKAWNSRNRRRYQNETTQLSPNSPYAVAKVAAHNLVDNYRRAYDIHASCGILFNHESERRGEEFVTRKITKWIGEYVSWRDNSDNYPYTITDVANKQESIFIRTPYDKINPSFKQYPKLRLGNLDARRDWGHAKDYVRAMWMMVQQDEPDDYVIATGKSHTIKQFLSASFALAGLGEWDQHVYIDPEFYRPCDVEFLRGCPKKAATVLGWKPEIEFADLVKEMVDHDIRRAGNEIRISSEVVRI